ncbi:hypothetical protein, partial [Sporisorium scitamineum]
MDDSKAQALRSRRHDGADAVATTDTITKSEHIDYDDHDDKSKIRLRSQWGAISPDVHSHSADSMITIALFILAAALRFYRISFPDQVVFDEVHFGKFAAYYLRREFHFDVHPPLAKLINAFGGYLAGFDGHFEFDQIGDKYLENNVPYVRMRAIPAIIGSLQVPLIYVIMRQSGYAPVI